MATCTNCAFDLGAGSPPVRCPRCGADTKDAAPGPGAPPAFDQGKQANPTLVGIPDLDDVSLTVEPSFAPPSASPGPPAAGPPGLGGDASGPPSIGIGGPPDDPFAPPPVPSTAPHGTFGPPAAAPPPRPIPPPIAPTIAPPIAPPAPPLGGAGPTAPGVTEFDPSAFGEGAGALELDLPGPGGPPFDGDDLDLPAPAASSRPAASSLDLPTPASGGRAGMGLPPPPPPPASALDLPVPVPGPGSEMNLPAPAAAPRQSTGLPDIELDLPQPASDLPQPAGLDLPQPAGLDLPQPVGLDLPQPAGMDLLEPATNLPRPADMNVQPAGGMNVQPVEMGVTPAGMDVAPSDLGMLEPRRPGMGAGLPGAGPGAEPMPEDGGLISHRRSPTPRTVAGGPASKGLLYGGAAIALVAALGVGVYMSGILDSEPDGPGQRGTTQTPAQAGDSGTEAAGPAQERSPEVLAKFNADTPAAYQEAMELAQAANDRVGNAEAALLLHLRYGPDPVLQEQANSLLQPFSGQSEPFVARVVGLAALAKGEHASADQALAGDGTRTTLYRGWLRLAQDRAKDAEEAASAVLASNKDDLSAVHLQHAAILARDPTEARDALSRALTSYPDHPGLRELMAEAGTQTGFLRQGSEAAAKLTPSEDAPKAYRARLLTLQGRLASARGDYGGAVKTLNESLTLVPANEAAQVALSRALVAGGNLIEAGAIVDQARQDHPRSVDLALLKVDVLIASGDGDKALEVVENLREQLPKRPEVPYLEGKVHAMRLQIEDGTAAFSKALQVDADYYPAMVAEAEMHAAARQPAIALEKYDGALRWAEGNKAPANIVAEIYTAKARLLMDQQQTTAALAALDKTLEVMPSDNEAQTLRGVTRLEQGMYAEGKADLLAVFDRTGGYPGMTAPLGRLLARENDIDRLAELVGDKADEPRASVELKLVGSRLKLLQGDIEGAKKLADAALAREPNNWEGQMLMGEAFRAAGDYAEALERINQAKPGTPQAELFFYRGRILEFNGKTEEARPQYGRAIQLDPELHEARFLYGRLLSYEGSAQLAIDELDKVIAAVGDRYPLAYSARGRARKELGNFAAAEADLAKATKLAPESGEAWQQLGETRFVATKYKPAARAFGKAAAAFKATDEGGSRHLKALFEWSRAAAKAKKNGVAKKAIEEYLGHAGAEQHQNYAEAKRLLKSIR